MLLQTDSVETRSGVRADGVAHTGKKTGETEGTRLASSDRECADAAFRHCLLVCFFAFGDIEVASVAFDAVCAHLYSPVTARSCRLWNHWN